MVSEMKKKDFYRGRLGMTIREQNGNNKNKKRKNEALCTGALMHQTLNAEERRLHAPSEGEMFTIVK